jgi:nucleoside 2-deoxyribosyltransferase
MIKEPLGYLGGDIMTYGSNLARQEEYDKFKAAGIPGDVYSPVQNKSINDKSNMTEEENNHLAEKICEADIERLWNSDYTVLCPEQSAIGTMCEIGVLYGWKYMADQMIKKVWKTIMDNNWKNTDLGNLSQEQKAQLFDVLLKILDQQAIKQNYAHYFDIRTNHLNEKDWRRSFSIN